VDPLKRAYCSNQIVSVDQLVLLYVVVTTSFRSTIHVNNTSTTMSVTMMVNGR